MSSISSGGTSNRPHTGRRRNEEARQAVLAATRELVHTRPYREVTIEAIVAAARVGKRTIYHWWPSRAALLLDALVEDARERVPPTDPDAPFPERLQEFLANTISGITGPEGSGPVLRALLAEAQSDPVARTAFRDGFIQGRRAALRELLADGRRAGLISVRADLDTLVDFTYGAIWYRLLTDHGPLDLAFSTSIATHLIGAGRVD
ncbi:TetR-like C-terminal domain-containing protein [Micromonospora arborensis]|uniref:TetR-like C-terminal domain-containing protein n=1 Tax=Micromonospora arborensis TaxID=2116518 RepID=UPI00372226F4